VKTNYYPVQDDEYKYCDSIPIYMHLLEGISHFWSASGFQ